MCRNSSCSLLEWLFLSNAITYTSLLMEWAYADIILYHMFYYISNQLYLFEHSFTSFFFEMAVVFKGIERSCLLDVYVSLFSPLYKRLLYIFSYLLLNNCLAHAKISSLAKSMELLELLKCLLPGHIGPQGKWVEGQSMPCCIVHSSR
jgi:hypothetical protein